MICVRGNNVFPAALETIIRRVPDVAEFRIEAYDDGSLTQLVVEVEPSPAIAADPAAAQRVAENVARTIQDLMSFRATVRLAAPGALPRFEMKAKRFFRRKAAGRA